jgi:poly(A) polymerase
VLASPIISSLSQTIYRQAINNKMFELDMKIAATHVKRKQLCQLPPSHVLQKRQTHSTEGVTLAALSDSSLDLSMDSDNSMAVPSPTHAMKTIEQFWRLSGQKQSCSSCDRSICDQHPGF